jgi:RND family efflux transporter MFP subunit
MSRDAGTRLLRASLALALALACGCGARDAEDEELSTSNSVSVAVTPARSGSIRAVVRAPGRVTPAPGAELAVTAPEPSQVIELPFATGDRVRRGEVVVRFEIPALDAELTARRSELLRANARVKATDETVTRLQGLFERGVAARKEVEEARRDLAEAQADVETAQGAIAAATALLARSVVTAPFDAIVVDRTHNPGDLVEGGADPVLRLIDPTRLQVEASVALGDLPEVAVGQPAEIRGPGLSTPIKGLVAGVPAAADALSGSARVRIALEGQPPFPANATVAVEIFSAEHSGIVVIPSEAVVEEAGHAYVYVVDREQKAHRREIERGIDSGREVEVRSGVAPGDRVIVAGQNALPDGATVSPRVEAAAAEGEPAGTGTAATPAPPGTPVSQP